MGYFPLFIDLQDKKCIVIGGGKVALRKVKVLHEFGADITVITRDISDENLGKLRDLKINKVNIVKKSFEIDDIKEAFFVVSTTNNREVNVLVSKYCKENDVLVNVADNIEECTFTFPAIFKDRDVTIGVSTAGKSPLMSKAIRDFIKHNLPKNYIDLTNRLGVIRENLKNKTSKVNKIDDINRGETRKKILEKLAIIGLDKQELTDEIVAKVIDKEVGEVVNRVKGGNNE